MITTNTGSVRNRDLLEHSEIHDGENKENEPNESDQVKNPSVSQRKGRLETKRYKSTTEKKPRAKYTCGTCVNRDIIVQDVNKINGSFSLNLVLF